MSLSQSARLQNLVLSIASRDGKGLDLSKATGEKADFPPLPADAILKGEQVLVLGAGEGRYALQAARATGSGGYVVAFESESAALQIAEQQESAWEEQLGYRNWKFMQTELHDLRVNPRFVADYLEDHTVDSLQQYRQMQKEIETQRLETPLIGNESVDVVLLDAVVNRLPAEQLHAVLAETFRVLRAGGRLLLAVLLADEPAPVLLPQLQDGRPLRHAPLESDLAVSLEQAGYHGITYTWRAELPLHVVEGVELRAFFLTAYKGKPGLEVDLGHAVQYKGPFHAVSLEEGQRFVRGERTAVSAKTYEKLTSEPYRSAFHALPSYVAVPLSIAEPFDAQTARLRDPQITKGKKSLAEPSGASCCDPGSSCGC